MLSTRKLKSKMVEHRETNQTMSRKLSMSMSTYSQKLNDKIPFSVWEANDIATILSLSVAEKDAIFFASDVDK